MKKVKASLPVEQTNQQQVHCDPSYMVCLESCDGHRFLIDRNCAMVSGVVQRAMQGKHCDGGCGLPQHAPCPIAADHGGAPNASPTPYTATLCTTPVDNATFTSTFASTSALSTASSEASMILGENLTVHVPQTDDNCSTTLIGSVRYNLFKLQEISGDLLDLAVQEMYHKYRYDSDPEKRPQESLHTAVEKHKFVALSVLLDIPYIINLRVKGMADQVNAGGYELQPYDGEEDVTNCSEVDESASRAVDDGVTWDSSREASDDGILSNDEFFNENSNDDDDDGNHSDRNRSDYDCEGEEGVSHELAATFSSALARDLESQKRQCQPTDYSTNGSAPGASRAEAPAVTAVKERVCCICKERSIYTCPGCGERTCSITCVRVHKEQFNCKGERDLAKKVSLSEFTDKQLQRDYHLLEDARRVVSNCERLFPKMWRYTFRALPPPLYALRKAAKQRGVVCQITSEGMCKRDANTSRFDRRSETIIWRCQFNFHGPDFSVSTDWGNERHRLGDILTYCWSKNPPIPCFHINRRYNRASKWVGAADEATAPVGNEKGGGEDLGKGGSEEGQKDGDEQSQHAGVSASNAPNEDVCEPHQRGPVNDTCAGGPLFVDGHTSEQQHRMWRPSVLDVVPHSSEEADCRRRINEFLSMGPVVILAQAERLGLEKKYFCLSPSQTLNEALRTLFFVNEFPVFDVVHASAAGAYELVTDVDKERIRESFRATPRPPKPERPPRRTKADLSPEQLERYAQVPCRLFLAGCCKLSDEDCIYRHCEYKDIPACRSFVKFSTCEKGERCVFRHDAAAVAAGRRRMREERQSKPRPRRRM